MDSDRSPVGSLPRQLARYNMLAKCNGLGRWYVKPDLSATGEYVRWADVSAHATEHAAEIERLKRREAECHDIIQALWAGTDPDTTDRDMLQRVARVLGADNPGGDCGNDYCGQLDTLRDQQGTLIEALKAVAEQFAREDYDDSSHITWCTGCDANGARLRRGEVIQHEPDCAWRTVDAALALVESPGAGEEQE